MKKLVIQKRKNDKDGFLRIVMGMKGDKLFIVYQGELKQIKSLLTNCYRALMGVEKELKITPDEEAEK